ncbi:hypothetical protein H8D73_00690 [bacterium]|nr:hypothetical protein [bacterium]
MNRTVTALLAITLLASGAGSAAAIADPELVQGARLGLEDQGLVQGNRAALEMDGLSLDGTRSPVDPGLSGDGRRLPAPKPAQDVKNPMVALLMSMVLPGWGEMYTGNDGRGRAFMAAEGAIWVGYASFGIQKGMREDDYREFAHVFAGVPQGSTDEYYQDIADYIRSEGEDSFNEAIRSEARSLYPDDLDAQNAYFLQHGYFGDTGWTWESKARFSEYLDLRHSASLSRKNAFHMLGLAVLNRAISGIDSAWMARRHNQGLKDEPNARLSIAPILDERGSPGSQVTLEMSF